MEGLHVVGSAGDDKKIDYLLRELEFDGAFNYKKESPSKALPRLCPNGIGATTLVHLTLDIYWENVGGETLDAVLVNANNFSRIIGCGMIASYGATEPYGVKNLMNIVSKRIHFEGFIQSDLREKYLNARSSLILLIQDFMRDVERLVAEKKIKYKEDITNGLENAIDAFSGMLAGKNFGKAAIKVAE